MTPKQRYLACIKDGQYDIIPRIPILMRYAAEYIGSNYGAFASDHRVLVEANIRCAEAFEFDQLSTISDPYRETSGFGGVIKYHESSVPECVKPPFADLDNEDLDALERIAIPDPNKAERMKDRLDAIRLFQQRTGDHYSIMGWVEGPAALACDLRGVSLMLMDMMEAPEWSGQLMDICVDAAIAFAEAQIDAGADTIGVGDAICSQISPQIYNEWIWPRQKRLFEAIKAKGAFLRLHICGQTQHLWSKLSGAPIDIFDCDSMVDMIAARNAFGPALILAGNLDPVADIRFGTADTIEPKVAVCRANSGSRFMVCAGCEIPSGTPEKNLKALCKPIDVE